MRRFGSGVFALSLLCSWVALASSSHAQPAPPPPEPTPETPPDAPAPEETPPKPAPAPAPEPSEPDPHALPPGHPPISPAAPQPPPVTDLPPVPLAPPAIFPSQLEDLETGKPLAGIAGGRLFIRDEKDIIRLYPGGRLRTDFLWSPGGAEIGAPLGEANLNPYLAVRRVRLELSGELFERLAFTMGMELGGQRIGGVTYTGADTLRFAPANAHDGRILPAEVSVSYRFRKWLNFTAGMFNAPISMSNRTRETVVTPMERPLAIQGFVVPNNKELGVMAWGELFEDRTLAYELGIFSGDGPQEPAVDAHPDFMGRIFARPLTSLGDGSFFKLAQIGISGRYGSKDQEFVAYDYPAIATGGGFVLWQPGYVDSLDRVTHVIPSGDQATIGGELRLPFDLPGGRAIEVRGEAYYVSNNTREAVDGFQLTNTERFGRVEGVGWYALASAWVCGDSFVTGEPGLHRPVTVDLDQETPILRGLEIFALAGGVHANYSGATREDSQPDELTPESDISILHFGGGLQYWYGRNFRAAVNYTGYMTPGSEDPTSNAAIVPDNLRVENGEKGAGNFHHELAARLAVTF